MSTPETKQRAQNLTRILVSLIVGVICGWVIGSQQEVQIVENVRYIERPATTIKIGSPQLYKSEPIDIPQFRSLPQLQLCDTVRETVTVPADTAAIISDYLQRREYDLDFSTDTTGVFKVQAAVEANKLVEASATIIPLQREVETSIVYKPKPYRPMIKIGVPFGKQRYGVEGGVGVLIKDRWLPSVSYMRLDKENFVKVECGIVF